MPKNQSSRKQNRFIVTFCLFAVIAVAQLLIEKGANVNYQASKRADDQPQRSIAAISGASQHFPSARGRQMGSRRPREAAARPRRHNRQPHSRPTHAAALRFSQRPRARRRPSPRTASAYKRQNQGLAPIAILQAKAAPSERSFFPPHGLAGIGAHSNARWTKALAIKNCGFVSQFLMRKNKQTIGGDQSACLCRATMLTALAIFSTIK